MVPFYARMREGGQLSQDYRATTRRLPATISLLFTLKRATSRHYKDRRIRKLVKHLRWSFLREHLMVFKR